MTLFKNETHQAVWIESNCLIGCWRGKGLSEPMQVQCPILAKALRTDRKPVEWTRNPRSGVLMSETIKCDAKSKTPGRCGGATVVTEDTGLFDVEAPAGAMDPEHQ